MQDKPTFEHPSEMSLFAELISEPKTRQDSLITEQADSYPHPRVKADIERMGRPRYDSIAGGPPLLIPHSPRAPTRHASRDFLMSSMPGVQARREYDERHRSRSITDLQLRRSMSPLRSNTLPESIREDDEPPLTCPFSSKSDGMSGVYLSPPTMLHKMSADSNSSDSELTVTPRKTSSTASNASELSGEADSGCEPHGPEVEPMPTQHQRRTGFDAATMPVGWVKHARANFEKITDERKQEMAKLEEFQRTKTLRSRSISHTDARVKSYTLPSARNSSRLGTQTSAADL